MSKIVNATLIGLGLIAATGAVAQAQSVSSLPPNTQPPYAAQPQGQTPYTTPYGSSQGFYPKPGGSEVINEGASQPPAVPPQANQPYPTGPKLN